MKKVTHLAAWFYPSSPVHMCKPSVHHITSRWCAFWGSVFASFFAQISLLKLLPRLILAHYVDHYTSGSESCLSMCWRCTCIIWSLQDSLHQWLSKWSPLNAARRIRTLFFFFFLQRWKSQPIIIIKAVMFIIVFSVISVAT